VDQRPINELIWAMSFSEALEDTPVGM